MTRSYMGYVSSQTTDTVVSAGTTERRVKLFTATDASYTVPSGVTYMVAHIRGGGGGVGKSGAGNGGTSSVAFAAGTQSASGGNGLNVNTTVVAGTASPANSGKGAVVAFDASTIDNATLQYALDGREIVVGGAVTAGSTLAVTVGAGGVAGTAGAAGGSGCVWLEYEVSTTNAKSLYTVQFTATDASYTVPAGVTHMVAHMIGGGGGFAQSGAGSGSASSVAFAAGTVSADGGAGCSYNITNPSVNTPVLYGQGARGRAANAGLNSSTTIECPDGAYLVAGGDVTAGATLAITVGAGGSGGTAGVAGAQGYVWLEFYGN